MEKSYYKNNMLSFRHAPKVLVGGHRAYNIDRALQELGIEMTFIENIGTFSPIRPSSIYAFTPVQLKKRLQILNFIQKRNSLSRVIAHGIQAGHHLQILKSKDIPIILDFRDDPILQHKSYLGYDKKYGIPLSKKSEKRAKHAMKKSFDCADRILFTSKTIMSYYPQVVQDKGIVCMNASDPEHFIDSHLPGKLKIGLLTGMMPAAGIELLLDACVIVKRDFDELCVEIVTGSIELIDYKKYMLNKYKKYRWIKFKSDITPYSKAPEFFNELYLSVNLVPKTLYTDTQTFLKVFDTMASARPIVVTDLTEQANIIREENCGLVCGFNPEDVAEKIGKILENRNYAEKLGRNGRKAVEERHSWKIRAQKIIDFTWK
ncbi:MAG TPA: glycosyltransferase [Thiotrichaceae bacterium]|nr:glycosyltransferase [Thiotrichaceae bacterium]